MDGIRKIDGFVLPKITRSNIDAYWSQFNETDRFDVMPTLETPDIFDMNEMIRFRDLLLHESYRRRILSLRIGGNDLLNHLCLRRLAAHTIYSTPLRMTIAMMAATFIPAGFNLTGPVFEALNDSSTLSREVTEDLQHGLLGKSAIHPDHVAIIENHYQVCRQDMEMAEAIMDQNSPAVFGMHGQMCEPATHKNWAKLIIERAREYGVL
jgi:citrate lyase beta subunit